MDSVQRSAGCTRSGCACRQTTSALRHSISNPTTLRMNSEHPTTRCLFNRPTGKEFGMHRATFDLRPRASCHLLGALGPQLVSFQPQLELEKPWAFSLLKVLL